ncbi:ATP-binding protein [Lampropedia hyalina]|nr:ATP-binding protein [Lampropedia hyalina]
MADEQPRHIADLTVKQRFRSIFSGSVGNLVEYFDWYVYAAFALYFAPKFFPAGDQTAQLMNTAAVFAIGFLVRIRDYGQGFDNMALQHLFEPFFTTKGRGEGLGLGLFISRVIVERFGGTLHAGNANPGAWLEITLKRASS